MSVAGRERFRARQNVKPFWLAGILLLSLAAPAGAQQIRIGATPAVTFVVHTAEQLGYFKAEGLTAQFSDFEGGAEVTTAMVGGSIDFAGTYVERPMILAEKGFGAKNLLAVLNQFQKQAGVVKGDVPYDKVVAVQFKAAWEQ